jgi:hypothetical protein
MWELLSPTLLVSWTSRSGRRLSTLSTSVPTIFKDMRRSFCFLKNIVNALSANKKLIPINKPVQIFSHERNVGLAIFVAPSGYSSTENMLLHLNGHIGAPKCIERVHVLS